MTRRRAKKPNAVRLLKQRYELLMGAINEGVYDWNVVDDTIYYSASVKQVAGLPPRMLKTVADWRNRIHPEDLPRYDAAFVDLFKGRTKRFECDYRFRAFDGSWRWARQHGVAVRARNGRVRRVVGATGDITELKDTEQALKQSEERYALATRAATEGIYEWNVETGALFISERAREVFGLGSGALKNTDWAARIHPDDSAHYRAAIIEHFKGRSAGVECEYRVRDAAGNYRWVLDRGQAVRRADGRAIRLIGAEADITQRKEALAEQTATAEILKVTSSSPTDVQPVFEAILTNALRLCEASFAAVFTYDGEFLQNVANRHASPEFARFLQSLRVRPSRETTTRLCALERCTIHTADLINDPQFSPPEAQRREKVRTALSVPMIREGVLVGVITLWRPEVRPFTDRQITLMETFAAQAVIAIENVRLFNETREALEQQKAIAEVLAVVTQLQTDVQPVFEAIGRNAAQLCGAMFSCVYRFDGELLHLVAIHNLPLAAQEVALTMYPMKPDRSQLSGRAVLTRAVQRLEDVAQDGEYAKQVAVAGAWRRFLAVPMLREEKPLGVIGIGWPDPGSIPERQVELLKTFADQAVIAIEKVQLFNETREALEQQTATAEILEITARSPSDVQPVFDAIARNAMRLCDGSHCALFRFDGRLQHFAAHYGVDARTVELLRRLYPRAPDPTRISGRAILEREVIHLADALADARFPGSAESLTSAGNRAVLAVPMLKAGEPIGVIFMVRREPRRFSDRQVALLKTFADQAVIAIENVRLFNETREALEQQTAAGEVLHVISGSIADTGPVFDKILESCGRLFAGRIVGLNLVHDDGMLHIGAYHGAHREEFERIFPIPLTRESGSGLSIVERRVVHYPEAQGAEVPARTRQGCSAIGVKSVIFAPLLWEGRGVGAIFVGRDHVSSFSEKDIALLRTFADQAVIAIQNVRLFNETKEALEQQKASGEVLQAISSSIADTAPVFDKILESCQRLFAGTIVGLNLLGEDRMMRIGAYHGPHREQFERIFPVAPGRSILERRVVHYPDAEHGADVPVQTREGCRAIGIRSVIFAPVLWEGRALGSIFVGRDRVSTFSEKETALLKTFADQAAIAIENAQLFKEIQDKSRQLEIASRHKSEFLANMSHELRTPLNAIIGFTRIVMRRSREALEAQQYENLEKILASGQNLLALINQVLDLSKVEAGRVEVHASQVELAPVLEQCLRTIEPLVKVALVREFDGGLPAMYVDEEKLRQIVINLLSNAARFTERGTIRLRAQAANGSVAITVADTGAGIAAGKLELIFEAFEQGDGGGHGGTGLGLTIARRLARLMGGDIDVESTLGTGSRFTLTLPLRYPA